MADKNAHAIYLRGLLFDSGYGVKMDAAMAFLLMREAAGKGHSQSVGHRFLIGRGVGQDYQNALQWLDIAAGSPHYIRAAMQNLSTIYARGLGTDVNLENFGLTKPHKTEK